MYDLFSGYKMNKYNKPTYTHTLIYAFFYWAFMAYGLDLVQAQASQVLPYLAWLNKGYGFENDLMGMTFPYYGGYSLWYLALKWLGYIFEPMTVVHIYFFIQCVLEVFGLRFLAIKLFSEKRTAYIWTVIVLFTFGGTLRHALGSVAPFGWTVFPDTFATAILLFALGYFVDKRFSIAFLILALSFNIHLALATFIFSAFFIVFLMYRKEIPLEKIVKTAVLFCIILLPLGIGVLTHPNPPLTANYEQWVSLVKRFHGHHVFLSKFGIFQYLPFLFWMVMFFISIRYIKSTKQNIIAIQLSYVMIFFLIITAIFTDILQNRYFITLAFFRASRFLTIFAVYFTTVLLFDLIENRQKLKKILIPASVFFITFFIFINIIVYHPVYRFYPKFVKTKFAEIDKKDNLIKNTLLFQAIKDDRDYIIAWKDVQKWCNENTEYNETILTPFYIRGFRSFSLRPIVFQYREVGYVRYFYFIFDDIKKVTEDIGMDFPLKKYNNATELKVGLEKLYGNYTLKDIGRLAEKYRFGLIVTEKEQNLNLPLKYSNDYFKVYELEQGISVNTFLF